MKRSFVSLLLVLGIFSPLFVACGEQGEVIEEQPLENVEEEPLEEEPLEEEEGVEEAE
jgi:hypothetical protein